MKRKIREIGRRRDREIRCDRERVQSSYIKNI